MPFSKKYTGLYGAALLSITASNPIFAQTQTTDDEIETIFVLGERRAYTGNIDELEDPTI